MSILTLLLILRPLEILNIGIIVQWCCLVDLQDIFLHTAIWGRFLSIYLGEDALCIHIISVSPTKELKCTQPEVSTCMSPKIYGCTGWFLPVCGSLTCIQPERKPIGVESNVNLSPWLQYVRENDDMVEGLRGMMEAGDKEKVQLMQRLEETQRYVCCYMVLVLHFTSNH